MYDIDLKNEILSRITIEEILLKYKPDFNEKKLNKCCFHDDSTPSLKIYTQSKSFYCFGCGASGDEINFVAKLFDENYFNAIQRINDDFYLNLFDDQGKSRQQLARIKAERLRKIEFAKQQEQLTEQERINNLISLSDFFKKVNNLPKTKEIKIILNYIEGIIDGKIYLDDGNFVTPSSGYNADEVIENVTEYMKSDLRVVI